jgi:hypothetical protein
MNTMVRRLVMVMLALSVPAGCDCAETAPSGGAGSPCTSSAECRAGQSCEATVLRCLPRAMGEPCEWRPPIGPFELVEE